MEPSRKRCGDGVLPNIVREQAVKLYQQGRSQRDIADALLIYKNIAVRIVNSYHETGNFPRPVVQASTRERKEFPLDTKKAIELYE